MGLLTAIIMENEGFSLNDLNSIQRFALTKVYKGRLNPDEVSDKEMGVLDSLVDLGLLDMGYGLTEDGDRAGRMMNQYSKGAGGNMAAAKQLSAEEETKSHRASQDRMPRNNFSFSESEHAIMAAAGLNEEEIMKIFLGENMLGGLTHYVVDPRNKELVTAFELGKCENCKGDIQEVNAINIDPEGAKRLRLKKMDYLPAEVTAEEGHDTTYCDECVGQAEEVAAHAENDEMDDDDDGEPHGSYDLSDDGDALASAGMGTDEDYGMGGGYDEW
jgi:hypothetical protein